MTSMTVKKVSAPNVPAAEILSQYKDGLISLREMIVWFRNHPTECSPDQVQSVLSSILGTFDRDAPTLRYVSDCIEEMNLPSLQDARKLASIVRNIGSGS